MMSLKNISPRLFILIFIQIGLTFYMFLNGLTILIGGDSSHLQFLNYYNQEKITNYPSYYDNLFILMAILQILSASALLFSLIKNEIIKSNTICILRWGIFFAIVSNAIYGFMVRLLSNHVASANMYFFVGLLYFFLLIVEKKKKNLPTFSIVNTFPIYFVLFYTMGFPAWQKLINPDEIMNKYVLLFKNSFLSKLPGGIEPFIYFIGFIELLVPVVLIFSLIKGEFLLKKVPRYLTLALFVTTCTFIFLCFGLSVISVYQGATSLIFYSIFTLLIYAYIESISNNVLEEKIKNN